MKIEGVIQRALEDEKYALKLRDLAYRARDEGMESRAYKALTRELAETPSDLRSLNTTMGYMMVLNGTTSKIPVLCVHLPRQITIGGLTPAAAAIEGRAGAGKARGAAKSVGARRRTASKARA